MFRPGMALSAVRPCRLELISSDGTGDRFAEKSSSASAIVSGVGITDVASPNSEFISSRRTFAVSGYKK
jgi:hypothetical protein